MANVRLRGQLEKLAGATELQVEGETVDGILKALEQEHSGLEGWILDESGALRPHINVFVNGEPAEPDAAVQSADKLEILPAISGGR